MEEVPSVNSRDLSQQAAEKLEKAKMNHLAREKAFEKDNMIIMPLNPNCKIPIIFSGQAHTPTQTQNF